MRIRKASGEEMLALWGYEDVRQASRTARFFYQNISSGNAVFWTVDHDGALIGELYAFLNIDEDKTFADGTAVAYLCAFRVKKEFRGQGLGRGMMAAALADLKARGFRRATIGAGEERNLKMYRRLGFAAVIRQCFADPCARDEQMRPMPDAGGFWLLSKDL
jgi:GNAT superfamily N-acetyltransferase